MQSSTVLYVFANNQRGKLVHISDGVSEDIYSCPGCKDEMIVVKGKVKAHHFRHNNTKCSYESYLHNTAKTAFYNTFIKFKKSSQALKLHLTRAVSCSNEKTSYLQNSSIRCLSTVDARYNLIQLFDDASLEKYDKTTGLTPDVMLSNTNTGNCCYVEIFVTHECSELKVEAGMPIIEINVSCEEDIYYIQKGVFSINDSNLNLYNFKVRDKVVNECHGNCSLSTHELEIWSLSSQGRFNKAISTYSNLTLQELKAANCWPAALENNVKSQKIKELAFSLDPEGLYDNCMKCIQSNGWQDARTYCNVKSTRVAYTEAKNCMHYEEAQ